MNDVWMLFQATILASVFLAGCNPTSAPQTQSTAAQSTAAQSTAAQSTAAQSTAPATTEPKALTEAEIAASFDKFAAEYYSVAKKAIENGFGQPDDAKLEGFSELTTDVRKNESLKYPYLGELDFNYVSVSDNKYIGRQASDCGRTFIWADGKWDFTLKASDDRLVPMGNEKGARDAEFIRACNVAAGLGG